MSERTYVYIVMHVYRDLIDEKEASPKQRRLWRKRQWLVLAHPHHNGHPHSWLETAGACATEFSANRRAAYLRSKTP